MDYQYRENNNPPYTGNVIYLSTFSKILAPGLRLAWVIAPQEVIRRLIQAKQGADLHTATFNQMVAYDVSKDGFLDQQIKVIRQVYGEHRRIMLDALEEYFPPSVKWTRPEGGLFLWITLPNGLNSTQILQEAIRKNVAFVPGAPFYALGGGENTLRINFSNASPEAIRLGIERLSSVIKENILTLAAM